MDEEVLLFSIKVPSCCLDMVGKESKTGAYGGGFKICGCSFVYDQKRNIITCLSYMLVLIQKGLKGSIVY